jgi:hypothetical protein
LQSGLRPCSRSEHRQEAYVLALAEALGVGGHPFFVEIGGNDGVRSSNTIFMEACRGWRGLLVEANPVSFELLRARRPGALALRAAVCAAHGTVGFVTRRSLGLARRGIVRPAVDETGGMESTLNAASQNDVDSTQGSTSSLSTARAHTRATRTGAPRRGAKTRQLRRSAVSTWTDPTTASAAVRFDVCLQHLPGCHIQAHSAVLPPHALEYVCCSAILCELVD